MDGWIKGRTSNGAPLCVFQAVSCQSSRGMRSRGPSLVVSASRGTVRMVMASMVFGQLSGMPRCLARSAVSAAATRSRFLGLGSYIAVRTPCLELSRTLTSAPCASNAPSRTVWILAAPGMELSSFASWRGVLGGRPRGAGTEKFRAELNAALVEERNRSISNWMATDPSGVALSRTLVGASPLSVASAILEAARSGRPRSE